MGAHPTRTEVETAELDLERDVFLRTLLRHLSGTLEEVVGLDDASGLVSIVGARIGQAMDDAYREAIDAPSLDRDQVATVLVDLKRRIEGDFALEDVRDEAIVLTNRACPFGDKVLGRESLCMMTSNVFGSIAARNLGYAKVELQETIARGDAGCRVVVHLQPGLAALDAPGREYFAAAPDQADPPAALDAPALPASPPPAAGLSTLSELAHAIDRDAVLDLRERLRDTLARLEETNRQLETRNSELERYAAAVAHDLRGPLVVVKGYAELLADADDHDEQTRELLQGLVEGTERMDAVVGALLTLARLQVTPPTEPTDPAAAMDVLRRELHDDLTAAGVDLQVRPLASAWVQPTHLVQVLTNLVSNAVKFASRDGHATIRVATERDHGVTRFLVDDDGPGVPPADRERIFELFDRGTLAQDRPGSGIGLTTVRKIVESYGGEITCEPSPLGGARFAFTVPDPVLPGA